MKEHSDKAPSKYLMYVDANSMSGLTMSQRLPAGGFKWLSDKQIGRADLAKYKEYGSTVLFLEVEPEYPKELHDTHNSYSLATERLQVSESMLYRYFQRIKSRFNLSSCQVQ